MLSILARFYALLYFLIFVVQPVSAKDVNLAAGLSLPPYIISDSQPVSGIEYEIVKRALEYKGHKLYLRFVTLKQVPIIYQAKVVDGAMTVNESFGLEAHYSDPVITYQNFAITLADSGLTINNVNDLSKKNISAFQNAKIYLGPEFAKIANESTYGETPNQLTQVSQLFLKRVQVVVSDKNIFLYYKKRASANFDTQQAIQFHAIFPPNPYKIAFHDVKLCEDFNEGLAQLHQNKEYEQIFARYISE